jgi:hypothetical protein
MPINIHSNATFLAKFGSILNHEDESAKVQHEGFSSVRVATKDDKIRFSKLPQTGTWTKTDELAKTYAAVMSTVKSAALQSLNSEIRARHANLTNDEISILNHHTEKCLTHIGTEVGLLLHKGATRATKHANVGDVKEAVRIVNEAATNAFNAADRAITYKRALPANRTAEFLAHPASSKRGAAALMTVGRGRNKSAKTGET